MHPSCPLKRNDTALQSGQKVEREADAANRKNREQDERVGTPVHKGDVQERREKVTDNEDRQIGRAVIGALMCQVLFADGAVVTDLQVA